MQCDSCGQYSDWIGGDSDWHRLNELEAGGGALLVCDVCGNHQQKR